MKLQDARMRAADLRREVGRIGGLVTLQMDLACRRLATPTAAEWWENEAANDARRAFRLYEQALMLEALCDSVEDAQAQLDHAGALA